MSERIERRYHTAKSIVLEERGKDKKGHIMAGYAATFNARSENLGGFFEIIDPGFFRKAILPENLECHSLFNHNPDLVLGATESNELKVNEDQTGLFQETDLSDETNPDAMRMRSHIRAKRIYKMSFAFTLHYDGDEWRTEGNNNIRVLVPDGCMRLYDVSPVTYPAYASTSVGMRNLPMETKDYDAAMVALVRGERNLTATKEDVKAVRKLQLIANNFLEKHGTSESNGNLEPSKIEAMKERARKLLA